MPVEAYLTTCWNCLGEFDALAAVWCSDDPKNPTKLCPFCLRCFCDASDKYKMEFWRRAPARLQEEIQTLSKSKDRLGDILIRMKKITTPQLLEVLVEQKATGKRLGEVLIARGLVRPEDIQAALKTQGDKPLVDTLGVAYASSPVWEKSEPDQIIDYILTLAARKGASDVQIESKEDAITVKYRIDGFSFRVDPIPRRFLPQLTSKLFQMFQLDTTRQNKPQTRRVGMRLGDVDYDLVGQTLPTPQGISATIKLVNRTTFIKDFTTLGLEVEDRVRLTEALREGFGLVLVTAPVFNGGATTMYSIMNSLVQGQRDVISLEAPVQWPMEGVRQVAVELSGTGQGMDETLRSVIAVRPDVLMLSTVPDRATAHLAAQLAPSILVVAAMSAQGAAPAIAALLEMGVPAHLLASSLTAVTNQRLVRRVCRICRVPAEPPSPQTLALQGLSAEEAHRLKFFKGKGCPTCNKVGYRGRLAIFEVLPGAPEVRAGILNGLPAPDLESLAVGAGMKRLRDRCLDLVGQGDTSFDEFARLRLSG